MSEERLHVLGPRSRAPAGATLIGGDCREVLPTLPSNSVHMVLTDPPYFLDGLDTHWKKGGAGSARATGSVGGLPVGMKFDPRQGRALQAFLDGIAAEWIRLLVPGGFALAFSQPRLAHRVAVAMEDRGFEIRDMIVWQFTTRAQFKAFSQDHFVRRMALPEERKRALIASLGGRKTPQLRPQFEAVIMAQKPREGTFVENWEKWRTGLMDATQALGGKTPANVMVAEKPDKEERASAGGHLTPKPLELLEHMIRLFTEPGQVVLDPFLGSGSTALAAQRTRRGCVGVEIDPDYLEIARARLASGR